MVATDLRAKTTIERYTAQQKQSLILFMLASTHQALCTCWWSMPPKAVWGNTWEPGDPQAWTTPLMWPRCLRNSSPSKTCSRVPTRSPEEWSTLHLKGYVIEGCASGRQKWKNHCDWDCVVFLVHDGEIPSQITCIQKCFKKYLQKRWWCCHVLGLWFPHSLTLQITKWRNYFFSF